MEIDSFSFPSLEDYSFLFPDMEPNVNTKKRNHPEDTQQIQWNNNNFNDSVALNDILSSLIQLDKQQQQQLPKQEQQQIVTTPIMNPNSNSNSNSNEFEIEFDFNESPTKKSRLIGTAASSSSSSIAGPQRRLWVKDRSKDWWEKCSSPDFPEEEFRRCFRMSKSTFELICRELDSAVTKKNTMLRDAIPVRQRVAVCIWRLATGDPLRLVSKRFGLGISTCHKLVLEVCSAIKNVLMPKFIRWPEENQMKVIKDEFESLSGISNVGGSMYTTHIPIIAPKSNVNSYFNKRHTQRNQKTSYSVTVQGVVDSKGIFTDVCIGWPGSYLDDQVLEKSVLYQRVMRGNLKDVWVVGNSGYPLMDGILVPYTHQNLTWTQHAFNEKVGDIQNVAKDAFSRVKGRWSCLQKRTEVKIEDLPGVLGACCVLHNICEMRNEKMDDEWSFELFDDEMVAENGLRSVAAVQARDNIAHDLLHRGRAGNTFL
ncbi:protein ALP1-like [Cicer arietinum]|uniref:Protein ANTAGONIST OF LIKE HETEROCHROMATIN PROTEIN 1 n=1 Tax=Cicer arietinum TaxID=3827 RepID=A0A1S2YPM5_CICAR|nr:protein ANTAGONIST OF LIKE HETEROCHROMATIN PROTEIN 1 [Cicer arietinum]